MGRLRPVPLFRKSAGPFCEPIARILREFAKTGAKLRLVGEPCGHALEARYLNLPIGIAQVIEERRCGHPHNLTARTRRSIRNLTRDR